MAKRHKAVPGRKKPSFCRKTWLFGLGVDPARWARKHDIEPFSHPCRHCGAVLTTSIPFAIPGSPMRGLVAPTCVCGNEGTPYCIVGFIT